jgi:HEPN domain-containing protein
LNNREKYEYWLDIAKYDLDTAEAMMRSGRYLYVTFMCQQSIEKLTKGIYVFYYNEEPPRTHNIWIVLRKILRIPKLREVTEIENFKIELKHYKLFFADLTFYYISERYPSYKEKLSSSVTKEKAKDVLETAKEVFAWIRSLEKYNK